MAAGYLKRSVVDSEFFKILRMDVSNAVNPSEPFGPKGVRPFRFPGILSVSSKVIQHRLVFWRQTDAAVEFKRLIEAVAPHFPFFPNPVD